MIKLRNNNRIIRYYSSLNYDFVKHEEKYIPRDHGSSPFRYKDGSLIKGSNSKEARLGDETLQGKINHSMTILPPKLSRTIQDNILIEHQPNRLREKVQMIYQELNKNQIQSAPTTSLEVNAHIGALFLQDYSHIRQVLLELQSRVENFNPKKVLAVGYGPGTGIIALNDIMKDKDWNLIEKEAYIIGKRNFEMKKRAKILLSAQEIDNDEKVMEKGVINEKELEIKTRLRDNLPVNKQYDLLIVEHSLLSKEYKFPKDVDSNLRSILKLLSPGGHLVLIERGNSVGFETIARARQIMIRPESYPHEMGKIPRPYIIGSTVKPQRNVNQNYIMDENLQQELNEKFGVLSEEDIKFDEEDDSNYEIMEVEQENEEKSTSELIDYHLKVIAPCANHRKCPLQLGDPKYYKIPSHKHRLNFCSFSKTVERPKYTLELKKGLALASPWDKSSSGGVKTGSQLSKRDKKLYEGKGRPNGRNDETGSYSYLIIERSSNDAETLAKINEMRAFSNSDFTKPHNDSHDKAYWPRIIENPQKGKKLINLKVCSDEGNIEVLRIPKSIGKQVYHDARKAQLGDLWPNGYKTKSVKNQLSEENKEKLDYLYKTEKKTFKKELKSKKWKKLQSQDIDSFDEGELATELMIKQFENSTKVKKQMKNEKRYNDNEL